jgi:glycosyltransferase involved in cell wall biosynthesis
MSIAQPAEIEIVSEAPSERQSDVSERTLLSLVIPVRDAAGSLPATLNAITRWTASSTMGVEVVVIDDGSSDGTRATASAFGRRIANLQVLRHVERRGRLEAIRTGGQAASGELIAFGSAPDLEVSLDACVDLLAAVLRGAEVAVLPAAAESNLASYAVGLTGTCFGWLRSKISRVVREPALILCRSTALRRMLAAAPAGSLADPDWIALARRAHCTVSVLSRD